MRSRYMKNLITRCLVVLSFATVIAGCGSDKAKVTPPPGPAPGTPAASGFVFENVKFGSDYLGSSAVIDSAYWENADVMEQMIKDAVARHNTPASQQESLNCAAYNGAKDGERPNVANMRVCFEKVCSEVPGYNFELLIVRMHVLTEITGEQCDDTTLLETYDFWENATAITPQFLIRNGGTVKVVKEGQPMGFDPFAVNLQVLDNGESLQGSIGTKILPLSKFNAVKYALQHDYKSYCKTEQATADQCKTGSHKQPVDEQPQPAVDNGQAPLPPPVVGSVPQDPHQGHFAPPNPFNLGQPLPPTVVNDRWSGTYGQAPIRTGRKRHCPCVDSNGIIFDKENCEVGSPGRPEKKNDLIGGILHAIGGIFVGDKKKHIERCEEEVQVEPRTASTYGVSQRGSFQEPIAQPVNETGTVYTQGAYGSSNSSSVDVGPLSGNQNAGRAGIRTIPHGRGDSEAEYRNEYNKDPVFTTPLPHSTDRRGRSEYEVGPGSLGRMGPVVPRSSTPQSFGNPVGSTQGHSHPHPAPTYSDSVPPEPQSSPVDNPAPTPDRGAGYNPAAPVTPRVQMPVRTQTTVSPKINPSTLYPAPPNDTYSPPPPPRGSEVDRQPPAPTGTYSTPQTPTRYDWNAPPQPKKRSR